MHTIITFTKYRQVISVSVVTGQIHMTHLFIPQSNCITDTFWSATLIYRIHFFFHCLFSQITYTISS